jgi:hypothetical protein
MSPVKSMTSISLVLEVDLAVRAGARFRTGVGEGFGPCLWKVRKRIIAVRVLRLRTKAG